MEELNSKNSYRTSSGLVFQSERNALMYLAAASLRRDAYSSSVVFSHGISTPAMHVAKTPSKAELVVSTTIATPGPTPADFDKARDNLLPIKNQILHWNMQLAQKYAARGSRAPRINARFQIQHTPDGYKRYTSKVSI